MEVNYYFARISVIATYSDKGQFILEGLRSDAEISFRNFQYGFFNVREIFIENERFFHGYIAKYKSETEGEVVDLKSRAIKDEIFPYMTVAKVRFFVHPKTGILIYHTKGNDLNKSSFINRFKDLLEKAYDNFFVKIDINAINESVKFFESLKKFKKIKFLKIELTPSNPENRDIWEKLDERLRRLKVTKYTETYQAEKKEESLQLDDAEINSKLEMANDGYGDAEVKGIDENGNRKTLNIKENQVSAKAVSQERGPQESLAGLFPMFKKIIERFDSNDKKNHT